MVNSIARKEITIKMLYWFRFSQKILVDLGFRKNCASFDFWTWVNTDLNFPIPKLTLHVLLLRVRSRAYVASTKFNLILRSLLTTFRSNLILKLARNETFHLFFANMTCAANNWAKLSSFLLVRNNLCTQLPAFNLYIGKVHANVLTRCEILYCEIVASKTENCLNF